MAKTFDGPPTLERSGSEHRRAVTSPLPEEEGLGEKVELSLQERRRGRKNSFFNGKEGRVGFRKNNTIMMKNFKDITVAVAGTGYVGLSIATLLYQHHHVTAVDIIPEKVEKLNNKISPIQDDYIEKYCYIAAA